MRLDLFLFENGFCESRSKARALIENGGVTVNGVLSLKPAQNVGARDEIKISPRHIYVSRSAQKLLTAKSVFGLSFENKTAVDIGASTGGFCEVLLEGGAAHVYAVDVGTDQLHPKIRENQKVTDMQRTDARLINADMFEYPIDIITGDMSFISAKAALGAVYRTLRQGGEYVCLVKPQFEVGPSNVGKSGVVKSRALHIKAVAGVVDAAQEHGFAVKDVCFSGVMGESGNREYMVYMIKEQDAAFPHDLIAKRIGGDSIEEHRHYCK